MNQDPSIFGVAKTTKSRLSNQSHEKLMMHSNQISMPLQDDNKGGDQPVQALQK